MNCICAILYFFPPFLSSALKHGFRMSEHVNFCSHLFLFSIIVKASSCVENGSLFFSYLRCDKLFIIMRVFKDKTLVCI